MTHILQNVVFPTDRDPDLLPLYVDPETWSVIDDEPVRVSSRAHLGNILGRTSARILAGRRVSFGTYFNAFPAAYWQHWTTVREVRLTGQLSGVDVNVTWDLYRDALSPGGNNFAGFVDGVWVDNASLHISANVSFSTASAPPGRSVSTRRTAKPR